jgi:hypothetical protein
MSRPADATRGVPIPPVLVSMLRRHLDEHGSTPDGRLFRGARGGILSESVYGRAWDAARRARVQPTATGPARPQRRTQAPAAARVSAAQTASEAKSAAVGRCPDPAHA